MSKFPIEYTQPRVGEVNDLFKPRFFTDNRGRLVLPMGAYQNFMVSVVPGSKTIKTVSEDSAGKGNVYADKYAGTITGDQIANATITGNKIANATIQADQIANGAINANHIEKGCITAEHIDQTVITAMQIGVVTITADMIENGSITANKIADLTITADKIQHATITANEIADLTITANKIGDFQITAGKIAANTITANEISTGLYNMIDADLPQDTDLDAYWAMDEGSGTSLFDGSSNGHTGTIYNTPAFEAGVAGSRLAFVAGSLQYADLGTVGNFDSNFTVTLWAKASVYSGNGGIFCRVTGAGGQLNAQGLRLRNNNNQIQLIVGDGSDFRTMIVLAASTYENTMIAIRRTGDIIEAFVNGVKIEATIDVSALGSITGGGNLRIGHDQDYNAYWSGSADEVRIYGIACEDKGIRALYRNPGGTQGLVIPIGRLTSGYIFSKQIQLARVAGAGDSFIACGKHDFTNVDYGFILGIDDSDGVVKFIFGNDTEYINIIGNQVVSTLKTKYDVGNQLLLSADTARSISSMAPYKIKEIRLGRGGNYRFTWEVRAVNGQPDMRNSYFILCHDHWIYPIQEVSIRVGGGQDSGYFQYTADFYNGYWNQPIYIYVSADGGVTQWVRNFRMYVEEINEIGPPTAPVN